MNQPFNFNLAKILAFLSILGISSLSTGQTFFLQSGLGNAMLSNIRMDNDDVKYGGLKYGENGHTLSLGFFSELKENSKYSVFFNYQFNTLKCFYANEFYLSQNEIQYNVREVSIQRYLRVQGFYLGLGRKFKLPSTELEIFPIIYWGNGIVSKPLGPLHTSYPKMTSNEIPYKIERYAKNFEFRGNYYSRVITNLMQATVSISYPINSFSFSVNCNLLYARNMTYSLNNYILYQKDGLYIDERINLGGQFNLLSGSLTLGVSKTF